VETGEKKRPTSVTVIACIFIGIAVLMMLSGAMAFAVFSLQKGEPFQPGPGQREGPGAIVELLFRHFDLLALFQINLAVFILVASIFFLKLYAWARTALEVVSWLGLAYVIAFTVFFVVLTVAGIFGRNSGPGGTEELLFTVFATVTSVVVMAFYGVPLGVIIWFLRGKTVREAATRRWL
jgi:hypothetical protein